MSALTQREKKERISGAVVSISVHAALLLMFLFWQLHNDPMPVEEDGGGILVNFGNSETGLGEVEPLSKDVSTPTPPQPQPAAPQKMEDVVTQDNEPAPTVNITKTKTTKVTDVKTKPTKAVPVETPPVEKPQKPKALFPGTTNNNSTGQGNTTPGGNQGKIYGNPNTNGQSDIGGGDNPLGKGGPGIGFSLSGRSMTQRPSISDNSQKTGKVVVNIKVDANGKVIYAKATFSGSTTEDSYLYGLAEKAAYQTRFNASPDMIEQSGKMTFTFKVK